MFRKCRLELRVEVCYLVVQDRIQVKKNKYKYIYIYLFHLRIV